MKSTKTAQDAKEYVSRQRGIVDLTDQTVRDALNEFYMIYWDATEQSSPQRLQKSADVDTTGGYDLTSISDIGSDNIRVFRIVDSKIDPTYEIGKVLPQETDRMGYYIQETTLYTTSEVTNKTVRVFYKKIQSSISPETSLSSHKLDIIASAEFAFFKFLNMKFYDKKIQLGLKEEQYQEVIEDLARVFRSGSRSFSTRLSIP